MFKVKSRKPTAGTVSNEELCRAVKERLVVRCTYNEGVERVIEPHCHGHSHAGGELLLAYQAAETAESEAGWKMFDVTKLGALVVTTEHFALRDDFNTAHPGPKQVHCRAD